MMKVVLLYGAVVVGAALAALVYFRTQDRGWTTTILFFGVLAGFAVIQVIRARSK